VAERSITPLMPSCRFTASRPDIQTRAASLFFSALLFVLAFQVFVVGVFRLPTVAMVCLVIDDEDILHAHQIRHDPLQHLPFGFLGVQFLTHATLQELPSALR
jgi:hypothetical protein